jgi:hypothetical protein
VSNCFPDEELYPIGRASDVERSAGESRIPTTLQQA